MVSSHASRKSIGFLEQRSGFPVVVLNRVLTTDGDEQVYSRRVVATALALEDVFRSGKQIVHREELAGGGGVRKHVRVEVVDGLRPGELTKGEVTLDAGDSRLIPGSD